MFTQARDVGMQVVGHPFHVEMVRGTLSRSQFERFIVQDIIYLEGCIKSFEIAKLRFPEKENLFELLISDTEIELDKHKEYRTCIRSEDVSYDVNKSNKSFIEFLIEVAMHGELAEIIGALWPCYFLFLEMYHVYTQEMKLLTHEHPYYEHVKYYKELLVLPSVEAMKDEMDRLFINAGFDEKLRLKRAFFRFFYIGLEHERRFFDSVYENTTRIDNAPRVVNSIISIRERLLGMPRGSWVVWDLDDTIWIPDIALLNMANNEILKEYILSLEVEYPNIRELIWELYYHCEYNLIEEEVRGLFSDLKEREIHVLGATKRETGYAFMGGLRNSIARQDLTLRRLEKLGVLFSRIFPENEILLMHGNGTKPAIIKDGVAFCSGLDKGPIIKILLDIAKELGIPIPPEIAFLDDLHENTSEVEEAFRNDSKYNNILVRVIQYRGADSFSDINPSDYVAVRNLIRALDLGDIKKQYLE